ncbi:protein charybde-like [Musca vetustissima]|uniref:protein charybde-like n=1 Tax=Musca vetustissima TaxID=27455 RepID=UPI002AB700DD|nr:protein charybde-like [Musca vetustissima]
MDDDYNADDDDDDDDDENEDDYICLVLLLPSFFVINAANTLPPSPSTETAVEATAIDDQCFYSTSPKSDAFITHSRRQRRRRHHSIHHYQYYSATAATSPASLSSPSPQQSPQSSPTPSSAAPPQPPVHLASSINGNGESDAAAAATASHLSTSAPPSSRNVLIGLDNLFSSLLMKMEVLSVQNHIQKQFGVIGSTKVKKDWTSSLTPPSTNNTPTTDTFSHHHHQFCHSPIEEHFDVVDGIKPQQNSHFFGRSPDGSSGTSATHFGHQQSHSYAMETATATSPPKGGIETPSGAHYSYNNNLLYCASSSNASTAAAVGAMPSAVARGATSASYHHHHHYPTISTSTTTSNNRNVFAAGFTPSPASSNLSTPTEATEHYGIGGHNDIDAAAVNELSQRLQSELRAAKSRHLSCTEVSLPWDLTPRIAADMIKTSEREPCGVRGCAIFIDFEDETGNARRIASFKIDPNTVSTFELFLTLKQDKGGWTSLLPQFLKNLTRSSTILISPHFTLNKHKLYALDADEEE